MLRLYIVESRSETFTWDGRQSVGVAADGYTPLLYLHVLKLAAADVSTAEAWGFHYRPPWKPWDRNRRVGRWTLDDPKGDEPRWCFAAFNSPKAHIPGNKSLKAYDPLTTERNPVQPAELEGSGLGAGL